MQVSSSTSVGEVFPLISADGNHPPSHYACATAYQIFNAADLTGERREAALMLQARVAVVLARYYTQVIERERQHLNTYVDHCDAPYDVDVARQIIPEIQDLAKYSPWQSLTENPEWVASAQLTIGNHLATAIHVERLLHADREPTNQAAAAYKARFIGS